MKTVLRGCTMTLNCNHQSNACGYHVIAFCLSRINNMSHDYISMFSDNLTVNDF